MRQGNTVSERFRWVVPARPERVLHGRLVRPARAAAPLPHVVILHGFKGFMDWGFFPELAQRFAARGIAAVLFNMSGSGIGDDPLAFTETEAFAANTHSRELEDVEHVRSCIRSGGLADLDPDRAALFGHSRGGGTALIHAAECGEYRALATWAAVDTFDRYDEATKRIWREEGRIFVPNARTGQQHRMDAGLLADLERNRARLDVISACGRLTLPTLLVHGTADEAVSVTAVDRLLAALPGSLGRALKIEGAGHTFGVGHPFTQSTPAWQEAVAASLEHVARCLDVA